MYHDRSISEISQAGYEPALTYSPGQRGLAPPGSDNSYYNESWQVDREGSSPAPPDFQYVVDGDPDEYTAIPAGAHLSPNSFDNHTHTNLNLRPNPNRDSYNSDPDNHRLSYYSASEIPAPSPMPEPRYMYYGRDGEEVARPLAADMSRAPSANGLQSPFRNTTATAPTYTSGSSGAGGTRVSPTSAAAVAAESVEMRAVRSPPSAFPQQRVGTVNSAKSGPRSASRTSTRRGSGRGSEMSHYATASEGEQWDEDDDEDDDATINHGDYSSTPHAL